MKKLLPLKVRRVSYFSVSFIRDQRVHEEVNEKLNVTWIGHSTVIGKYPIANEGL